MKKLVTALMVVLPLVFLVALFAITTYTSIVADVPVTGLKINNKGTNGILSFDIADYENPLYQDDLGIEILPNVATNKDFTLKITDNETNEETNIVSVNEDGSFALNDVGLAKLTYTSKDGNFSDSVVFNVSCSGVLSIEKPVVRDLKTSTEYEVNEGETTDYVVEVESGLYDIDANFYPSTAVVAQASFKAQNPTAIDVNEVSGRLRAQFGGNHIVEMSVEDAHGDIITKTVEFRVKKNADVTINAEPANENVTINAPVKSKSVTLFVNCDEEITEEDIDVVLKNGISARRAPSDNEFAIESVNVEKLNFAQGAYAVHISFTKSAISGDTQLFELRVKKGAETQKFDFSVEFAEYSFEVLSKFTFNGSVLSFEGTQTKLSVSSTPDSQNVRFGWAVDDLYDGIVEIVSQNGTYCTVSTPSRGHAIITVICEEYQNGEWVEIERIEKDLTVAKRYTQLVFTETTQTHGLGTTAIAGQKYDGDVLTSEKYLSGFTAYNGQNAVDPSELFDISFTSSDNSVARVSRDQNGVFIDIKYTDNVTISATYKYGELLGIKPATFTFKAVDGVSVSNYEDLVKAQKAGLEIVLANDVYLGEDLFTHNEDGTRTQKYDDATMRSKLLSFTNEMDTTFDWTYYKNIAEINGETPTAPKIRYCFEFTNNFYGNGYMLNAEYITNMLDSTDNTFNFALFKGPLNFVATSYDGMNVSVKAQDNIVFLVRKDGVNIDNAVLKGCNDDTLYVKDDNGNSKYEIGLLNNMGTTLEIMANANITNCRISNGRTVARVFGRDGVTSTNVNPSRERINVKFDNCDLSHAREFILKVGTNRTVKDSEVYEPSFYNANNQEYTNFNKSACDNYANDEYFMQQYVLTDVTLKDSTLRTSGLFTVGMESHFAGGMLNAADGPFTSLLPGWKDLAGTSYPAILRLEGDVRLLDWKPLSSVDSSTLIESKVVNEGSAGSKLDFLKLDINAMLQEVQKNGGSTYGSIIDRIDGEPYVHGGIAMYGGGKNYSIVDTSKYTFHDMSQYNVNIGVLANSSDPILKQQGELLPGAAGSQDFRFFMFDAGSDFKYQDQQNLLK